MKIRATEGQPDVDRILLEGGNEQHIEALRRYLVGTCCVQAGELEDGALTLEFESHILVFSGIFFISPVSEIKQRPGVQ